MKWHFRDPKVKNFWGQHVLGWAAFSTTTFLPRMHTPSKSHATPLISTEIEKKIILNQAMDNCLLYSK